MPRDSGQVTALRPASIAVHDYGNVLGKLVGVKLREQTLFLNAGWFERVRYFHAINPANSIFWRAPNGAHTPERNEDSLRTFQYSGWLQVDDAPLTRQSNTASGKPPRLCGTARGARTRLQKLT